MTAQHQIIYFPYLCFIHPSIEFGGMILWNFNKEKDTRISNVLLKEYVEKLLNANVSQGHLIQDIAVFSEEPPIFQPNENKAILAEDLRRILFLSVMASRNIYQGENAGDYMATSENFTHVFQNFQLGNPFTAFTSGSIVQINDGGYEVGKVHYEKPPHVLQGNCRMDDKLFEALKTLKELDIEAYSRILKATGAFMSGYFNSDELTYETRILQQCRAFEILLDLTEDEPRKVFKEKVRLYCFPRDEKFQMEFSFLSERRGGRKEEEKNIMAVKWADSFYTLRNHIIHGETIEQNDFKFCEQAHWHISLWVFLVIIKKIINKTMQSEKFYDEILWKDEQFCYEKGDIRAFVEKYWEHLNPNFNKVENL